MLLWAAGRTEPRRAVAFPRIYPAGRGPCPLEGSRGHTGHCFSHGGAGGTRTRGPSALPRSLRRRRAAMAAGSCSLSPSASPALPGLVDYTSRHGFRRGGAGRWLGAGPRRRRRRGRSLPVNRRWQRRAGIKTVAEPPRPPRPPPPLLLSRAMRGAAAGVAK